MSVKNNRYLMAQLHDTKNIYIKNDIKGTYINSEENDDYMIGSFDGSSMLYICDSSILNSHLKNPAQYGIVYVPSRYLFIEIQTNNTAAVIFNQHEFKEMFENMGYKTMEIIVKPCNKNSTLIFQFECTMALYSNINNFQTEANASMSNKPTKFIEYSKLILEFEFQVSNPSASRSWIEKRVNSLCKEYINSLLVSILEVNYPLVFNKKTRSCCQRHLSSYKNLQTIKVPMTYIFKTLSYASIASTTTMMDILVGKIERLPL
ncbi:uncharacterized protein HGUI_00930 [Hanseniaspora guilliermondii]|uniref:Uncharacterized protein n=1 Tax=Hanseniaspora guilliermondii TaxID=56406 RepID=A0A1L0AWS6_9ASCO|nr:uncharacterized protein HGUI_00930 [Hanseniaspora guilliermondii]